MKTTAIAPQLPDSNRLIHSLSKVFIIACKESTHLLETTLAQEGLLCEVLRQHDQPEFEGFSPSYRCLLNHCRAWEQAAQQTKPTLIVEADFVPVIGLGQLPLPYNSNQRNLGIAWLYTCAPQIYSVSKEGYAQGFSTSMVAYIVTPQSAQYLTELVEIIRDRFSPNAYSTWDSQIDQFLRDRNFQNYISFRNYGEHGGRPNPEHRWHGLSTAHRADVLYGKLAFLPLYALEGKNAHLTLLRIRLHARLKGIARSLTGKFLRTKVLRRSSVPIRLIRFAIQRQLTIGLEGAVMRDDTKRGEITISLAVPLSPRLKHDPVLPVRG